MEFILLSQLESVGFLHRRAIHCRRELRLDWTHAKIPKIKTMNNEQKYPKTTPENRDHMPVEVAIAHLTNPLGKLSARFRKVCATARETVYTSQFPIRLAGDFPGTVFFERPGAEALRLYPRKECFRVYDTTKSPKTAEARFSGKLRTLSWGKLYQIALRCNKRSDKTFEASQRVLAGRLPEPARTKLAEHLQAQSQKFDFLMGLTNTEINRRVALCKTK